MSFKQRIMETNKQHQQTQAPTHTYDNVEWSALSDTQKTKWLLGSMRMMDAESFLQEFGSFEQPELTNNLKVQATR